MGHNVTFDYKMQQCFSPDFKNLFCTETELKDFCGKQKFKVGGIVLLPKKNKGL